MADSNGMNTASVDERIVEAKFDASDFEKGVDKTIKKLDELKESLNLKDAGKSVSELADETKQATEKASSSLTQLEDRLTSFAGMLKQKLLSGLADQVVGVFFKMENAVTGFVKSMTIGMSNAGMAAYEQMLTSVRMVTNAFKRDDKGKIIGYYSVDEAYGALEQLKTYADETSYSMDQMTDAMSKMVAAGVPLEDAAKNVQGIANACANAGINATDAARAFFNLSQAYSSGSLKYTDYRSLELLNMTNESFKQAMLDAGVAAGTLKKTKEGQYKTQKSKKTGGKVTAGKTVNMQNLSESLKYGWMTTAGMDELFGGKFYADIDEITDMLYEKNMKMSEVLEVIRDKYGETAAKAFAAAREARNFTDVLNTWRGIATAQWSKVWELLFGKLEEATKFFTDLADGGIADTLRNTFGWITDVLDYWNEGGAQESGQNAFIETIQTVDELIGQVNDAFMTLLPNSEDTGHALMRFSIRVRDAVKNFQTWLTEVNSPEGTSRLDTIINVIGVLTKAFGAASIFSKAMGVVFHALGKAFDLMEPILNGLATVVDKLIDPIIAIGKNDTLFNNITDSVDNLFNVLKPVIDFLSQTLFPVVGDVLSFFVSGAIDTAIMNINFFSDAFGLLLELITGKSAQKDRDGKGIVGHITDDIETLKNTCIAAISAVKDFFSALFDDLRRLLGLSDEADAAADGDGGIFNSIKNFFDTNQFLKDADAWVQQAKVDVENWIAQLPEKITNFGVRIQEAVFSLFYTKKSKTVNTSDGTETFEFIEKTELKKNLDEWWETTKRTVTDFITSLPQKVSELANQLFDTISGLFYSKDTVTINTHEGEKTFATVSKTEFKKNLDEWWSGVKTSVTEFTDSIPQRIQDFFNGIPNVWQKISDYLLGEQVDVEVTKMVNTKDGWQEGGTEVLKWRMESGLSQWLTSVRASTIEFIKTLPKKLEDLGKRIYTTVFGIFYQEQDVEKSGYGVKEDHMVATPFKKWVDGVNRSIRKWLKKVSKITLRDLWDRIFVSEKQDENGNTIQEKSGFAVMLEGMFGEAEVKKAKAKIDGFVDRISAFIENVKTTINNVWTHISTGITTGNFATAIEKVFTDVINFVASLFTGTTDIETNAEWFSQTVADAITWIKTAAEAAWPKVRDFIASLPTKIANLFSGESSKNKEQGAIGKALTEFGKTVGGFVAEIPDTLLTFFNNAGHEIEKLWDNLYKTLSGESASDVESIDELMEPDTSEVKETVSKWDSFVENLSNGIIGTFQKFPKWLAQGFELSVKGIDWALSTLTDVLTPKALADSLSEGTDLSDVISDAVADSTDPEKTEESAGLAETLAKIGQAITNLITVTIPKFIIAGFEAIKTTVAGWVAPIGAAFERFAAQVAEEETLTGKIRLVGSKIKQKILDIIPDELEAAFGESGIGKKAAAWWDGVKTIFDNLSGSINEEGATFFSKIGAVGNAIVSVIKLSIPDFIKQGFNSVRTNFGNWWNSLDGIFDDWLDESNQESSPLKRNIAKVGKAIKKAIDELGKLISGIFGGQGEEKSPIKEGQGPLNPLLDTYKEMFKQAEEAPSFDDILNEATKSFMQPKKPVIPLNTEEHEVSLFEQIISFVDNLMTKVGEYIQKAFGIIVPFVIQGWNSTVQTIGKIISTIGDLISGKPVEEVMKEVFGEDIGGSVSTALNDFGNTITNLFTKIIPDTAEKVKASIEAKGGFEGIFSSIFGGEGGIFGEVLPKEKTEKDTKKVVEEVEKSGEEISKTANRVKEVQEKAFEDAVQLYGLSTEGVSGGHSFEPESSEESGGILGFIDRILGLTQGTTGFVGQAALIVIGLKMLADVISGLKEVLSLTDEVDAFANAVKWTGITVAIGGLIALLGYILPMAANGETEKLERVKSTLETLVSMFERVGQVFVTLSGIKVGGSIFEALGSFFDYRAAKNSLKETQKIAETGKAVAGEAAESGDFIKNLGLDLLEKGGGILLTGVLSDFIGGTFENLADSAASVFGSLGVGIQNAFSFISPAIQEVVSLSKDLDSAIAVFDKLKTFMEKFNEFTGTADSIRQASEDAQKEGGALLDAAPIAPYIQIPLANLEKTIDFLFSYSIVLKNLGDAIKAIDAVEDPAAAVDNMLAIVGDEDFSAAMTKLMEVMGNATSILTWDDNANKRLQALSYSMTALAQGIQVLMFGVADFATNDVGKASRAVEIVEGVFSTFAGINVNKSALEKLLSGDDSLSAFGRQIQAFGGSVSGFFNSIRIIAGLDEKSIGNTKEKVNIIVELAKGMSEVSRNLEYTAGIDNIDNLADHMDRLGASIGGFLTQFDTAFKNDITLDRFTGLSLIISALGDFAFGMAEIMKDAGSAFGQGLIPEYISQFVQGIASLVAQKEDLAAVGSQMAVPIMEGLQYAFDHPEESGLQLRITPVLNMADIESQVSSGINVNADGVHGLTITIPDDLQTKLMSLPDYSEKLEQIRADVVSAVNDVADPIVTEIGVLKEAIGSMKLKMEGRDLVAGIMPGVIEELNNNDFYNDKGLTNQYVLSPP